MPMRRLSIDLKLRLALRVAAIAALCCVAAALYALFAADRAAHARADFIAEVLAKDLALQQDQSRWISNVPHRFPDLQRVAAVVTDPGLCIGYRAPGGEIVQRLCNGAAPGDVAAPKLFAALYRTIFNTAFESARPVFFRGAAEGEAVVGIDPQILTAQSWRETSRLLAVMACALLALCLLTYAALAFALRPTRAVRAGLERLAAGDLSARLPTFDLAELSAIADVFNQLAGRLETTLVERNTLTRRLIVVQDEERQHLARELHDEFGQCLAAVNAMAVSAGQTAARECPALLPECQSIASTAAHMMDALRGALLRLRPPDVEELGLAASLEGLVAGWNSRSGAHTRFSLEMSAGIEALPKDFAASLYRVAQEAVTNAVKHARASRVILRLCLQDDAGGADQRPHVELTVDDDGKGGGDYPALKTGMGLLGMRERIAALGGRLSLETSCLSGLKLCARIPVPPLPRHPLDVGKAA